MVRAILQGGVILPLSPLPSDWSEGQELVIDEASPSVSREELEAWSLEMDELTAGIPEEDFERLEAALAEADEKAKELVRRQMGLA